MKKLIKVGFFVELPYGDITGGKLKESVGKFSSENISLVISYLKSGIVFIVAPGISRDFLSTGHEIIGSLALRTDGKFLWPSDLSYYVEKYHVGLPWEFLDHMHMNNWNIPKTDIATLEL